MTVCIRVIALSFAMLLLAACQSQPRPSQPASQARSTQTDTAKRYPLRGVVLEIHKEKRELRVKHEDIPGYMKSMTMNFPVRDDAALATLAAGDEITADLNVAAPGEYWLSNIRKTGK